MQSLCDLENMEKVDDSDERDDEPATEHVERKMQ